MAQKPEFFSIVPLIHRNCDFATVSQIDVADFVSVKPIIDSDHWLLEKKFLGSAQNLMAGTRCVYIRHLENMPNQNEIEKIVLSVVFVLNIVASSGYLTCNRNFVISKKHKNKIAAIGDLNVGGVFWGC